MKNINVLTTLAMVVVWALFAVSCEKSETETDLPKEDSQDEGFNSHTGHNDSIMDVTSKTLSPLLHLRYDASLSKEEAEASFDMAVAKFIKENGHAEKTSSYFTFRVWTRTGNLSHSQTDGNVWARFNFLTDKGPKHLPWVRLNNEGDDRENGAWDFYYFGSHASSINWLETKSATLALQGTDGWYVKYFDVRVYSWDQYVSATGSTRILSDPETWLDNATSGGWDYYYTGYVGTGRLNF